MTQQTSSLVHVLTRASAILLILAGVLFPAMSHADEAILFFESTSGGSALPAEVITPNGFIISRERLVNGFPDRRAGVGYIYNKTTDTYHEVEHLDQARLGKINAIKVVEQNGVYVLVHDANPDYATLLADAVVAPSAPATDTGEPRVTDRNATPEPATTPASEVAQGTSPPPPVLTVPQTIERDTENPQGIVVTFETSLSVPGSIRCSPASGSRFLPGTTEVMCDGIDNAGNSVSQTFSVIVKLIDREAPDIDVPDRLNVASHRIDGAPVEYAVRATDNITPSPRIVCAPASGTRFPIGETRVTCFAEDKAGNRAQKQFTVDVSFEDIDPPAIRVPGTMQVTSNDVNGTTVNYQVFATDNSGVDPRVDCSIQSGSHFPVGTTTVSCESTDESNNRASAQFDIVVSFVDITPPVIAEPDNVDFFAYAMGGIEMDYQISARDDADESVAPECNPRPGSVFAIGETKVRCQAADSAGNKSQKQFTFYVYAMDNEAPTLQVPQELSITTKDVSGAVVDVKIGAQDNFDKKPDIDCTPVLPGRFPVGTTEVTCTAKDNVGNKASASFNVNVELDEAERQRLAAEEAAKKQAAALAMEQASSPPPAPDNKCFIEKMFAGKDTENNVAFARLIRDNYLANNAAGRFVIDFYYRLSPYATRFVEHYNMSSESVRDALASVFAVFRFLTPEND